MMRKDRSSAVLDPPTSSIAMSINRYVEQASKFTYTFCFSCGDRTPRSGGDLSPAALAAAAIPLLSFEAGTRLDSGGNPSPSTDTGESSMTGRSAGKSRKPRMKLGVANESVSSSPSDCATASNADDNPLPLAWRRCPGGPRDAGLCRVSTGLESAAAGVLVNGDFSKLGVLPIAWSNACTALSNDVDSVNCSASSSAANGHTTDCVPEG
jgi:hypothetical protein